jgi:hypothetical protein
MKRHYLFFAILIFFSTIIYSQSEFIQIGAKGNDGINDLVLHNNNLYITGYFQGNFQELKSKGNADVFTAKLNSNKEIVWVNALGSDFKKEKEITEYGKFIKVDNQGNSYVTGLFYNTILIKDKSKVISKGKQDIFIVKYDINGNQLWIKSFGTINNERIRGLFLKENSIYLIAELGIEQEFTNNRNIILKLDLDGKELLRKEIYYKNLLDFKILDIKQSFDNFYLSIKKGDKKSILKYNSKTFQVEKEYSQTTNFVSFDIEDTNLLILSKNKSKLIISKKDVFGNLIWKKNYDESMEGFSPKRIIVDSNRINLIGYVNNSKDKGSVIYEMDNKGEVITSHNFSSDYQNRIIKHQIVNGKLFLVGQFYNSFTVNEIEITSKGRIDSFIDIKSLYETSNDDKSSLLIYPNPNNGEFYVRNSDDIKSIKVYDLVGKLIYEQNFLKNPNNLIKIRNFSAGVYNIVVKKILGEIIYEKVIFEE